VSRWAWAEVDLDAIAHNVGVMRDRVAPSEVWAVVKADGYGHGSVDVARAALGAGAAGLCVALTDEGAVLRAAGIDAPVLVLSEQPHDDVAAIVAHDLTPTVYSTAFVDALEAHAAGCGRVVGVHLKIDTGMQRVGVPASDVGVVLARVAASEHLSLAGAFTHLACADEPDAPSTQRQLEAFDDVLSSLPHVPLVHAANSAAALAHPAARRSLVRVGIAMYGVSPGSGVDHLVRDLRPAMSLRARVSFVKRVAAGSSISYGHRHTFVVDTNVATVPIGYADGVPRRLGDTGGEVLVGGRRRPIVGAVTMDQLMVDVGDDSVTVGDEVVLIGRQGAETVTAEEWAARLGTIGYEIVCGVGKRIQRIPRPHIRPSIRP
jgi:alanine racemase